MTTTKDFGIEDNLNHYVNIYKYPVKDIDAGICKMRRLYCFTNLLSVSKVISVAVNGGSKPEHHKPPTIRYDTAFLTQVMLLRSKDLGKLEKGLEADIVVFDFYSVIKDSINANYPKVKSVWIAGKKTFEIPDTVVSVNENKNTDKYEMIYPNPVSSQATIIWNNQCNGNVKITITDILGTLEKTIYDGIAIKGKQELLFDVSEFYGGMYIINISNVNYKTQINAIIVK